MDELARLSVPPDATLRQTLAAIDAGASAIALVVDGDGRLEGVMTDGDVRRALLEGCPLDGSIRDHVSRDFISVPPEVDRAEVLDLMQARMVAQVPVLDDDGRVVALHLLREIIGAPELTNWVVIMAGGRGTRLGRLTEALPKPMIHVAGRPILERIVLQAVGCGFRRIFLSINYLGHLIEEHFGDGSRFGCRIEYLREDEPLGTAGSLSLLPERPREPLLLLNGDLVTQARLDALLRFHLAGPQQATVGIRRYWHEVPFGCVELEGDRIVTLEEKPRMSRMVNTGIYALDPGIVSAIPSGTSIDMPAVLTDAIARQQGVWAFEIEEDWLDVGRREQLEIAQTGSAR